MLRRIIIVFAGLAIIVGVAFSALTFGYYAHREQIEPIYNLGERAITKGRRVAGLPTETVSALDRIETTYLTLHGEVHLVPNQDFHHGGALALRNGEVIVLHASGRILVLNGDDELVDTGIAVPDSNKAAYLELAAKDYPDQFPMEDRLRYNDLEYIESASFVGFVLSYTFIDVEKRCYSNRISMLEVPEGVGSLLEFSAQPDDWTVLYDSKPCLSFNESRELIVGYMAGGRMAFKAPNLLYLGNGEYHREGFYRPDAGIQSDDSDYGKTIEINIETGTPRHYSKGHRNLQGITLDAEGRLWTTEHGMRGGDELNLIRDQENYGWPLENLGTLYSGIPAPTEGRVGRHEIYAPPIFAWLPSAAVSSLALVEGFDETWDGDLLIGSLRGRTLFRARIQDDRIVFMEEIPIGQRIRDVMQVADDKLALWLDTEELVILTIEERVDPLEGLVTGLTGEGMAPEIAEEALATLSACNECHSFEENIHQAGPSLFKVAGRDIASTAFANYSDALLSKPGSWDVAALQAFLLDPEAFAPGTAMSGQGVGNPQLAEAMTQAFVWLERSATEAQQE